MWSWWQGHRHRLIHREGWSFNNIQGFSGTRNFCSPNKHLPLAPRLDCIFAPGEQRDCIDTVTYKVYNSSPIFGTLNITYSDLTLTHTKFFLSKMLYSVPGSKALNKRHQNFLSSTVAVKWMWHPIDNLVQIHLAQAAKKLFVLVGHIVWQTWGSSLDISGSRWKC